ncbi:hypothetical protein L1987_53279 [Smallanthus sonchifolius]|uniref:Uncharacterized protein n=1 Tax=Smallanthus sonchifolius TaxID=185202 RepID=A0ACB9EWN4_9ASTR|nr:hypothetical protein L1987_53279 [Smallanthus sonchifolius]
MPFSRPAASAGPLVSPTSSVTTLPLADSTPELEFSNPVIPSVPLGAPPHGFALSPVPATPAPTSLVHDEQSSIGLSFHA